MWTATLRVTFTEDIADRDTAELWANHCIVQLVEGPITAIRVQNAETVSVDEEVVSGGPGGV